MLTKEKWRWSWFVFKTSPRLYSNTQGSASNTFLSDLTERRPLVVVLFKAFSPSH